jgi:YidC/Oxa1 family membrane protein insertase
MYIFPVIFAVTGVNFPIGVLIYWTTTNLWSMGQQFYVIRNNPAPGSEAERAMLERKARKAARKGTTLEDAGGQGGVAVLEAEPVVRGQRQQPLGKNRAKRSGVRPTTAGSSLEDDSIEDAIVVEDAPVEDAVLEDKPASSSKSPRKKKR